MHACSYISGFDFGNLRGEFLSITGTLIDYQQRGILVGKRKTPREWDRTP